MPIDLAPVQVNQAACSIRRVLFSVISRATWRVTTVLNSLRVPDVMSAGGAVTISMTRDVHKFE